MNTKPHKKNTQKAWIFLGLLVLCGMSWPAQAQNERETANRIKRLENEVQTLSRAIYKGEEPPPGAFSGGSEDAANLTVRLDQLETQIRGLTGKLEEQTYEINQLKSQMERMSGDIDMRLNNVGSAVGPARYTATPPEQMPAPQDAVPSDMAMPYPQAPVNTDSGYQWSSGNDTAPPGGPSLGNVAASNDAGAQAYENAFSLLKNGQYDAAEQGFQTFLTAYPNHTLGGNAKYWLGETYYARGQYDKASRTFAEAYQQYPKGAKAPDNLLKLGLALAGQGKKEDACIALGQIEKDFGATAGPVVRRAQQEMANFGC